MKIDSDKLLKQIADQRRATKIMCCFLPKAKIMLKDLDDFERMVKTMIADEERKPYHQTNYALRGKLFDEEKIYKNCTVQQLHNTITDEYSVCWWDNEKVIEND